MLFSFPPHLFRLDFILSSYNVTLIGLISGLLQTLYWKLTTPEYIKVTKVEEMNGSILSSLSTRRSLLTSEGVLVYQQEGGGWAILKNLHKTFKLLSEQIKTTTPPSNDEKNVNPPAWLPNPLLLINGHSITLWSWIDQDMLYQWSMPINADQYRINTGSNFWHWYQSLIQHVLMDPQFPFNTKL